MTTKTLEKAPEQHDEHDEAPSHGEEGHGKKSKISPEEQKRLKAIHEKDQAGAAKHDKAKGDGASALDGVSPEIREKIKAELRKEMEEAAKKEGDKHGVENGKIGAWCHIRNTPGAR